MLGGKPAPPGVAPDNACVLAERPKKDGGSNTSKCLEALRWRKKLDEEELKGVTCEKTAFLAHTWWDGPMVRVVAMFLRSFRATQHAQCAKLVVWTPGDGTERSTERGRALVEQVEAMSGAPVVFQTLHMEAAAGVPRRRRFSRDVDGETVTDAPGRPWPRARSSRST